MAKLIVLSGVPGSGKSYFSDAFRKAKTSHVYIVSSDHIRYEVTGSQQNMSEDKLVWKLFYGFAKCYSMDKEGIVILDATNSVCKYRVAIIEPFRKFFDEVDMVAFDLPIDIVRNQNRDRLYPIQDDIWEELYQKYEGPNDIDHQFFDKVITITDHNIQSVIEELSK